MEYQIEQALRPQLSANEKLIWCGRPRGGMRLRSSDVLMVPFSLMWCGFAIFWEYSVVQEDRAPAFFAIWGIPFVCIGLYIVFGRFIADAMLRARTVYGLTEQRAIIMSGFLNRQVKSVPLRNLSDVTLFATQGWQWDDNFRASTRVLRAQH
jgi:hypothetical protein